MRSMVAILSLFLSAVVWFSPIALCAAPDTFTYGAFGTVTVYRESDRPSHVVLFISGDGGWNKGVVDMANSLASIDALVAGIDITHYLKELRSSKEECSYPAGDFELLSKFIQHKYGYPGYVTPVLVGYSSGATLVYAALVQSPPNTFKGAISLGFCPDLPLAKPFCRGEGLSWTPGPHGKGYSFLPAENLEVPWIALQGLQDQVCDPAETEKYVQNVKKGEIVLLPKVGHGYSSPKNWLPQFKQAFLRVAAFESPAPPVVSEQGLGDLPVSVFPATGEPSKCMAVFITGDGGWGVTDKGISQGLADRGIPVVGLNSMKYFWKQRTPEESARDMDRILSHYLASLNKEKAVLVGYSIGADVIPFMVNGLPAELRGKIQLIVLIGPGHYSDFKFHVSDWLTGSGSDNGLQVRPQVEKLRGMRILCFHGEDDKDALCPELEPGLVRPVLLKGGHRIRHNYSPIIDEILANMN